MNDQEQPELLERVAKDLKEIKEKIAHLEDLVRKSESRRRRDFTFGMGLTAMAVGVGLVAGQSGFTTTGTIIFAFGLAITLLSLYLPK